MMTKEDKREQKEQTPEPSGTFICNCGKSYKHRQGLWKHRTKCLMHNDVNNINSNIKLSEKEIIEILVEQNKKLMNLLENCK